MISRKVRRNVLLIVGILIVILLIVIFSIIYNSPDSIFFNRNNRVARVDTVDEYYNVQTCVKKFYEYYKSIYYTMDNGYGYTEDVSNLENVEHSTAKRIYNLLEKRYIEQYGITTNNISEKLEKCLDGKLQINDVYRLNKKDDLAMYIVYAQQIDTKTNQIEDFNIMVEIDYSRSTFGVLLNNYITDFGYNDIKENEICNIELNTIFSNGGMNKFTRADVDQVEYVEDMFEDYRDSMLDNKERAYNLLDEETKNSKFNTFESYNEYIKNNIKSIIIMEIKTYKVNEQEKYTDYEYVDTYGNQYTFRVTSPMKYTVIIK